ncbi:hypothetical protein [Streptomyces sp. NPDC051183]
MNVLSGKVQKQRRERLGAAQLGALAELGVEWAHGGTDGTDIRG